MAFPTEWREVKKLDTDCRPTKKGDPQISINTEKDEWIKVSGVGIQQIKVGDKIEISTPSKFGQSWYARLNSIEIPAGTQPAPMTPMAVSPNLETPPTSHANGNGKIPYGELSKLMRAAHFLASELEPDPANAQARMAMVNTAVIAATSGKIDLATVPDVMPPPAGPLLTDDVPF